MLEGNDRSIFYRKWTWGNSDHPSYFCWREVMKPQRIGSTISSVTSERRLAHLSLLSLCESNQLQRSFLYVRCLWIEWFQLNSAHFTLTHLISTMSRTVMVTTDQNKLDHANTEVCDRQSDTKVSSSWDDDLHAAGRKNSVIEPSYSKTCVSGRE